MTLSVICCAPYRIVVVAVNNDDFGAFPLDSICASLSRVRMDVDMCAEAHLSGDVSQRQAVIAVGRTAKYAFPCEYTVFQKAMYRVRNSQDFEGT
jgi:hypothetical protein